MARREDSKRYRGQMSLVVEGYNNEPRKLVETLELRSLLRGLEADWQCWFFLNQAADIDGGDMPAATRFSARLPNQLAIGAMFGNGQW